jgi:glycogen synthase
MSNTLEVLFLSPEVVLFAKSGGLADVAGSLPLSLNGTTCMTGPIYTEIQEGIIMII